MTPNFPVDPAMPGSRLRRAFAGRPAAWLVLAAGLLLSAAGVRAETIVFVRTATAGATLTTSGAPVAIKPASYYAADDAVITTPAGASGVTQLLLPDSGLVILLDAGAELVFERLNRDEGFGAAGTGYDIVVRLSAGVARFVAPDGDAARLIRLAVEAGSIVVIPSANFVVRVQAQPASAGTDVVIAVLGGAATVRNDKAVSAAGSQTLAAGQAARFDAAGTWSTEGRAEAVGEAVEDLRQLAAQVRSAEEQVAANPLGTALPTTLDQESAVSPSFIAAP